MLIPRHGIASRRDLPLPLSFVVVGAVLALVISSAILIFAWHKPRFHHVGGHHCPGLTAVLDHPIVRLIAACWCWPLTPGRAGDDSGPGSVDESDPRPRLCLDVGSAWCRSRCYSASSGAPPTHCGRSTRFDPCRLGSVSGRLQPAYSASAGSSWFSWDRSVGSLLPAPSPRCRSS